jgi:hypothetical protein
MPGVDDELWQGRVFLQIRGEATATLCATDQLFHVLVHGMRYETGPSFYWAADAATILGNDPSAIDWQRLTALAVRRRLAFVVTLALRYLKESLAAPVPAAALAGLEQAPTASWERTEHLAKQAPRAIFADFRRLWHVQRRMSNGGTTLHRAIAFPQLVRDCWDLDETWQIPLQAPVKISRRFVGSRRRRSLPNAQPPLLTSRM